MGFFTFITNQLPNFSNTISRDTYDTINIAFYLLLIVIVTFKAYYSADNWGYRKNVFLQLHKALYFTTNFLLKNKISRITLLLITKIYNQKMTVYLRSSRIPYYFIAMRPYVISTINKAKTVKNVIKSYYNSKN